MDFAKVVHLVITIEKDGKFYSYARSESGCNNLVSIFRDTPGVKSANVCTSHKEAARIAAHWNDCYITNGCYLYGNPKPAANPESELLPF